MKYKFLSLFVFVSMHFSIFSQVINDVDSMMADTTSSSFNDYLATLPDSTSTTIHNILSTLNKGEDSLAYYSTLAHDLKSQLSVTDEQNLFKINPFIENLGFLNNQIKNLKEAVQNLQNSEAIDFEIAYILEIEKMLRSELEKRIKRKKLIFNQLRIQRLNPQKLILHQQNLKN